MTTRICRHPLQYVPHAPNWLDCPLCAACFPHRNDCPGTGTTGCGTRCMSLTTDAQLETYRLEVLYALPAHAGGGSPA